MMRMVMMVMMTTFSTTLPAVKRLELKLQEITASGSDSTRQCRVTYISKFLALVRLQQ